MKSIRTPIQDRAFFTVSNILSATARLLEDQDLKKLNTNKIATKAGVGIATIYRYFSNQEAIINALCERIVNASFDEIRAKIQASNPNSLDELISITTQQLIQLKAKNSKLELVLEFYFMPSPIRLQIMEGYDKKLLCFFKEILLPYSQEIYFDEIDLRLKTLIQGIKGSLIFTNFSDPTFLKEKVFAETLMGMMSGALKSESGKL